MNRWQQLLAAVSILGISLQAGAGTEIHPVVDLVRHGECAAAVAKVNQGADQGDASAVFWGARMLDEGICVDANAVTAGQFYARAADLGEQRAALEHAARVGLGDGTLPDYAQAGALCRAAGLGTGLPAEQEYSLGYACTLSVLAARNVRTALPPNALRAHPEPVQLRFAPASGQISILSTPAVLRETDAPTGSHSRKPRVDIEQVVNDAWKHAVSLAPQPDAARLAGASMVLALDVDLVLEQGALAADRDSVAHGPALLLGGDRVLARPLH